MKAVIRQGPRDRDRALTRHRVHGVAERLQDSQPTERPTVLRGVR